jgi:hypothetical protein
VTEKFNNFPTLAPLYERGKVFSKQDDFAFRAQQDQQEQHQRLPPPPPHVPQPQHFERPDPQPQDFEAHERQPVKKEAQPFRFPDENPPNQNFHQTSQPTFQQRRPEPEFIYDDVDQDQQEYQEPIAPPAKRKVVSQPPENSSDEGDRQSVLVTPLPSDERRKKIPKVIEANKARNPLDT